MSIIQGTAKGGSASFYDFPIEQSLRFDGSSYLSRTPTTTTNSSHTTYTYSVWLKYDGKKSGTFPNFAISAYSSSANNPRHACEFMPDSDEIRISFNPSGTTWYESQTNMKFRDSSSWYHIVLAIDMNQSQAVDRAKIYVNSTLATYRLISVPNQYTSLPVNTTNIHYIGSYGNPPTSSTYLYRGYLANIQFIDGQALDASYFGETKDDIWTPKRFDGTSSNGGSTVSTDYGTNGFLLDFSSISGTTINDTAPIDTNHSSANNWTATGF
jgi:hypothetical protein